MEPLPPSGTARVGRNKFIQWRRIPTPASPDIERADKLLKEGKADEAETIIRELLSAREKELGADHPALILLLRGLGTACWAQGKLQEAQVAMKRAIDLQLAEKTGPTEDLAYDLRVLGQSYREIGQLDDAQWALALGLYTIDQAEKDDSRPMSIRLELLYWLARTMQQDGEWSKAEPLLQRLYRLQTQHQEPLKITAGAKAETLMRLALSKSMQGDHKGAEEVLRNAIDLSVQQRGQEAQ